LIVYTFAILTLKASIILQCMRVFIPAGVRNRAWWLYTILLAVHVVFYIATQFIEIFRCTPTARIWDSTIDGHCIGVTTNRRYVAAAINSVSDVLLLLLAQKVIWSLSLLPANKKRMMSALFLIGIV